MFQNKKEKPLAKAQQQQPTKAATLQKPQSSDLLGASGSGNDYLIFGAVLVFVVVIILHKFVFKKGDTTGSNKGDQHGTAGFASLNEIKELTEENLTAGDVKIGEVKDLGVLTKLVRLPLELSLKHTAVVGPTGAGKSRGYFLPNCHDAGRSSFVATDPKSELWDETAYNNLNAVRFAPTDPNRSAAFNFVAYCKEVDFAENVAAAIVTGSGGNATGDSKFWSDAEEELMTGILLHIANSDAPTPTHLYNLLTSGIKRIAETLKNSEIQAARALVASFMESDKKNKSGIIQGLSGKLRFLNNPAIRRFTSSKLKPFDFKRLREKPVQVYWCLEQDEVKKLETLSTIFFSIVVTQLLKQKSGKIPVNLFFDEFANVGKIKGFANHITLLRGQGVAVSAGLQSISQIESLYGSVDCRTILDNFNNKLLMAGIQGETGEEFSRLMGDYTYTENTESFSESGSWLNKTVTKSTGVAKHARRLMTADELRRLNKKKVILISTNLRPVKMKKLKFQMSWSSLLKKFPFLKQFQFFNQQIDKMPKMAFQCGQEIPAPEYQRIEPATAKKKSYDDI